MTPAELDRLIASKRKPGKHGDRNCPKCGKGYMAFHVMASSHIYACDACHWVEWDDPPWKKRKA